MAVPDPIPIEPRRFSIGLPRPRWTGWVTTVLLVTVVGLQFGLPLYRQHLAIREIKRQDGYILTAAGCPRWLRDRLAHKWMTLCDKVNWVDLSGTQATDATLRQISCLTSLQHLSLDGTQVTDAGLANLEGLSSLQSLALNNTQVTDAGLVHLNGMTSLRSLSLTYTPVTHARVAELMRTLPGLLSVDL